MSRTFRHVEKTGGKEMKKAILATKIGNAAADYLAQKKFGNLIAIKDGKIATTPLSALAGQIKPISKDEPMVQTARDLGICFGD